MTERKDHWDAIFGSKSSLELTWYQPHLALSLELIRSTGLDKDAHILDLGCGDSTLVDDLIQSGYTNLTLLDVSGLALERCQERLGQNATQVTWIEGDITQLDLHPAQYHLWHDRAVFHFLTDPVERGLYVLAARRALAPGGYLIIATFALDGPEKCSGLPVVRYTPDSLSSEFGSSFRLLQSRLEIHRTPWGGEQSFQYSLIRKL
jgi:SAM-dependent methyltransferase